MLSMLWIIQDEESQLWNLHVEGGAFVNLLAQCQVCELTNSFDRKETSAFMGDKTSWAYPMSVDAHETTSEQGVNTELEAFDGQEHDSTNT